MHAMPLQNRVLPTQEIVTDTGRGLLMGNRGSLHRPDRTLGVTRWRSKAWITCVLNWKGVQRDPMPPGRWTALFFLDEATAFAAGHRPCAYCRRADFTRYGACWAAASALRERPRAAEMDARLHGERVDRQTRRQRTAPVAFGDLPDGAMVRYDERPALVLGGGLLEWSWQGYGPARPIAAGTLVDVLTPAANRDALSAGYSPLLHPTAMAQIR
jgi:hypothetical protein